VASGGATHSAIFSTRDISISGELSRYSYTAASGNTLTHSYCGSCGTPIMAQSSADSDFAAVRLGFLDPAQELAPKMAIWIEEAPGWAVIDEKLERFSRQPPPPAR